MPSWYRWWDSFVGITVVVLFVFVIVVSVVLELQLLEDLLELMRRSRRTTYGMWVIAIVHDSVCACASQS